MYNSLCLAAARSANMIYGMIISDCQDLGKKQYSFFRTGNVIRNSNQICEFKIRKQSNVLVKYQNCKFDSFMLLHYCLQAKPENSV